MDTQFASRIAAVRRARFAAQVVFLSMAGTTMTFQVYHAIRYGHMPWWLAALFGIVPLLIAIGVLEFVAEWDESPKWAKPGAYLIVAGAMLLSATSTGDVVLKAAPPDMSWLFGVLLDGAAVLAVTYILHGPKPAALVAKARAEQEERERAENGELGRLRRELAGVRDRAEADHDEMTARIAAITEQHQGELASAAEARRALEETLRREHSEAEVALTRQLEEAAAARAESEQRAANAEANIADLTRRLEANAGANTRANRTANGGANRGTKPGRKKSESAMPGDVAARAQALQIYTRNPDISGAELGRLCGKTPRWGQFRIKEFEGHVTGPDSDTNTAPSEAAGDTTTEE